MRCRKLYQIVSSIKGGSRNIKEHAVICKIERNKEMLSKWQGLFDFVEKYHTDKLNLQHAASFYNDDNSKTPF